MKVDKKTLQRIAHLARLDFKEESEEIMLKDLNRILEWVEELQEVDTTEVKPLIHISEEINNMRKDEVLPPLDHKKALQNAPKKDSDYFRVPKVLEN